MDEQRKASAEIAAAFGAAMQQTADAIARFGEVWRASEAAEELRKFGYRVPR